MIEMSHDIAGNEVGDTESIPALPTLTIIGTSGTRYTATNLLTELTTRQKNAARDCIASVLPTLLLVLKAVQVQLATDGNVGIPPALVQELIRGIDLEAVFNAMLHEDLDLRLIAVLYLPESDRVFRKEDVDNRMDDLMDLSYGEKFGAFKAFFTMNSLFSPSTSDGFMQAMLTPKSQTTMQ